MIKLAQFLVFASLCLLLGHTHAGSITIAAASDLRYAMNEIVAGFELAHPGDQIHVVYGSSGKFHTQIQQGAPYDLFFSADIRFPRQLAEAGLAGSEITRYAFGRIVLWSNALGASQMTLASLTETGITRIAIANPRHAPYGMRAREALTSAGVWSQLEPRLVYGENIAQTAQFVATGNAQVGIIALALALSPQLAEKGSFWLVPEDLHEPLEQGFIVTRQGKNNPLAHRFAGYMEGEPARSVMTRYGFTLPDEQEQ